MVTLVMQSMRPSGSGMTRAITYSLWVIMMATQVNILKAYISCFSVPLYIISIIFSYSITLRYLPTVSTAIMDYQQSMQWVLFVFFFILRKVNSGSNCRLILIKVKYCFP